MSGLKCLLTLCYSFVITVLIAQTQSSFQNSLQSYGQQIEINFPNEENMLGVGGLTYDPVTQLWMASSENIARTDIDKKYPETSKPRVYNLRLNFTDGTMEFVAPYQVVDPGDDLKLESIAGPNPDGSYWLASEANSDLYKTSLSLSKDFGPPDIRSYHRDTFANSRLVRINPTNGVILETPHVPSFAQWDQSQEFNSQDCTGDRPFQGFHALSVVPNAVSDLGGSNPPVDRLTMIVGIQTALYQDGSSPTEFRSGATRLLYYDLNNTTINSKSAPTAAATATYSRAYRYDTSQLTLSVFEAGSRHFNALFGMLAINETSLLVAECEDYYGIRTQRIINRIFYVEINLENTVDHCQSLLECNVSAPLKWLLWEQTSTKQLDGIGWGPDVIVDGKILPTVALTFEEDDKIGAVFQLLTLDTSALRTALSADDTKPWPEPSGYSSILRTRVGWMIGSFAFLITLVIAQFIFVYRVGAQDRQAQEQRAQEAIVIAPELHTPHPGTTDHDILVETLEAEAQWTWKNYLLFTAMSNSFLVGGLIYGIPGMALILRKEGYFAESCSCGTFCNAEKEHLAIISTFGFAVTIGSRLFCGFILDAYGPKLTSVISATISFVSFLIIAFETSDGLTQHFVVAWLLLSLGGAGLHVSGFHISNLFKGGAKKSASTGISATFGASSIIFPLMQILSQYADVPLKDMAAGYSVIVFLVLLNNFLVMPWATCTPGSSVERDLRFWYSSWWQTVKAKVIDLGAVLDICKSFTFWGETLFFSVVLLLITHYLSTSAALMFEKGDVKLTNDPNNYSDFMFARLVGIFNAIGFIWFPTVEYLLRHYNWPIRFSVIMVLECILIPVVIVPVLEIQVIGFVVMSVSRLLIFSCHFAYILEKFGVKYFGILNGVSSLVAGMIGLLSFPLQLLAVSGFSYGYSFLPIAGLVILSGAFPFLLRRQDAQEAAEKDAEGSVAYTEVDKIEAHTGEGGINDDGIALVAIDGLKKDEEMEEDRGEEASNEDDRNDNNYGGDGPCG